MKPVVLGAIVLSVILVLAACEEAGPEQASGEAYKRLPAKSALTKQVVVTPGETFQPSCLDSDSGLMPYQAGQVRGTYPNGINFTFYDACINNVSTEYYCDGTLPKNFTIDCTHDGCGTGSCLKPDNRTELIPPNLTCNETDEGFNFTVPADAHDTFGGYVQDRCDSAGFLVEGFCCKEPGYFYVGPQLAFCDASMRATPFGVGCQCSGGACIIPPPNQTNVSLACTDTDDGINFRVRGTVTYTMNYQEYTRPDACTATGLREQFCLPGNNATEILYPCPYGCVSGACLPAPNETSGSCSDSDGGIVAAQAGRVGGRFPEGANYSFNDACLNNATLEEYYCELLSPKNTTIICPLGCTNSSCIQASPNQSNCTDPDGGFNYAVRATTTDSAGGSHQDACLDFTTLREGFCQYDHRVGVFMAYCPCSNGVCTNQTNQSWCTDSDGGRNYATAGRVRINTGIDSPDMCHDANNVVENYCTPSNTLSVEIHACPCANGACTTPSGSPVFSKTPPGEVEP